MKTKEEENYQGILALLESTADELPKAVADLSMVKPEDRPDIMGATREHSYRIYTHLSDIQRYLDDIMHYGSHLIQLVDEIQQQQKGQSNA